MDIRETIYEPKNEHPIFSVKHSNRHKKDRAGGTFCSVFSARVGFGVGPCRAKEGMKTLR